MIEKEEKEKSVEKTSTAKKVLVGAGCTAGALVLGYVLFNKPDKVTNPCKRCLYRQDGVPKKAFDSRIRANIQSLYQLIRYGEICNPYQVGDKFYTGHNKYSLSKFIKKAF